MIVLVLAEIILMNSQQSPKIIILHYLRIINFCIFSTVGSLCEDITVAGVVEALKYVDEFQCNLENKTVRITIKENPLLESDTTHLQTKDNDGDDDEEKE